MAVYINNRRFTACEKGQENSMCLPKLFRNSDTGLATSNYVSNPPYNKRLFNRIFKDAVNKNFTMCPKGWINCNKEECLVSEKGQDPHDLCMNNNNEFCKPLTTFSKTDPSIKVSPCVYNNDDNILIDNAPGIHDYTDPQECLNACEKIIDRDSLYNINGSNCTSSSSNNDNNKYKKNCWGVSVKVDDNGKTVCQYLNDFPTKDSLNDSNLSKLHIRNYRPYNLPNKPSINAKFGNNTFDFSNCTELSQKLHPNGGGNYIKVACDKGFQDNNIDCSNKNVNSGLSYGTTACNLGKKLRKSVNNYPFVDLGITSESLQKYNNDPSNTSLFDLYNVNPYGAGPDGKKKNSSDDYPIFNNSSVPQSKTNVIQYSENIGPSFTGPFDKGTIDSNSGTALMDFLSSEHFVNKCGSLLCDNYRGFTTIAIIIFLITLFIFKKIYI